MEEYLNWPIALVEVRHYMSPSYWILENGGKWRKMEIWEKGNPNFANCPGFNYCPIFQQFNFLDFIHNPTFWNTFLPSIIKLSKICKHFSILPKLASSELIARVDKCKARLSSCNLNLTPSTQTISPTLVYHLYFIEKHPILRIIIKFITNMHTFKRFFKTFSHWALVL